MDNVIDMWHNALKWQYKISRPSAEVLVSSILFMFRCKVFFVALCGQTYKLWQWWGWVEGAYDEGKVLTKKGTVILVKYCLMQGWKRSYWTPIPDFYKHL